THARATHVGGPSSSAKVLLEVLKNRPGVSLRGHFHHKLDKLFNSSVRYCLVVPLPVSRRGESPTPFEFEHYILLVCLYVCASGLTLAASRAKSRSEGRAEPGGGAPAP